MLLNCLFFFLDAWIDFSGRRVPLARASAMINHRGNIAIARARFIIAARAVDAAAEVAFSLQTTLKHDIIGHSTKFCYLLRNGGKVT